MTVTVLKLQKAALLMNAICIYPFKSTNLHITVCGILIERDWIGFIVTLLLVVWQRKTHITMSLWYRKENEMSTKTKIKIRKPIVRICNSCVVLCLYVLFNWRLIRCIFVLFQRTGLELVWDWTSSFEKFISDSRNAPKRLRKTVNIIFFIECHNITFYIRC